MGTSLVGIDFSASAIRAARVLANTRENGKQARFIVADATETGLPSASVDGIVSVDALMFVDACRAAHEIARLLRPHGVVALTTVETLVDPPMPTLVRDYRPIFEAAGLRVLTHEVMAGHRERSLEFYRALEERADALRAEIGEPADTLLEEARGALRRAKDPQRMRPVFMVARRVSA